MHYSLVFFFVVLGSLPLLNSCSSNRIPKIVFSKETHNFPEPSIVGSEIVTTFTFTNKGNTSLHILKIDSDCGCIATNTSSDKIAPGDKGEIRVAVERNVGRFRQNVFVFTDDPITSIVRLVVSGVIVPPVAYQNKIELGQLEKRKRVFKKIKFTNNLKEAVDITGHTVSNKGIAITLSKKSISKGESIECEVELTLNDVGFYDESLTISAQAQEVLPGTDSKELEMSIQFQGRVLGGIVVLPQNLFIGVLDGSGKSVQKKVQIKTDGNNPFALTQFSAYNFSVTASTSQKLQTEHEIELSITPKTDTISSGLVEGEIKIFTTHPDVPEITIPVKAVNP